MKGFRIALIAAAALLLAAGASAQEDVKAHPACAHCGMDREKFAHSRMLLKYGDGTAVGTCSLRCAALDLRANKGKDVRAILVADRDTKELLDATKADWVIQWDRPGVMTKNAKWAFRSSEALEVFVRANGGARADWEAALRAATEELPPETRGEAAPPEGKAEQQAQKESSGGGCCRKE